MLELRSAFRSMAGTASIQCRPPVRAAQTSERGADVGNVRITLTDSARSHDDHYRSPTVMKIARSTYPWWREVHPDPAARWEIDFNGDELTTIHRRAFGDEGTSVE